MSGQIGEAFVRVRAVGGPEFSRSLNQQTTPALQKFSRQVHQAEQGVGRFSRGALIGTGVLHSFGRAAVFASTTLLGGYGLTFALRKSLDAARNAGVVQGQLANAVQSAGIAFGLYRGDINQALAATEALGFSSDETGRSYATLIRATRDVTKSTRDQALAANIARATNRSLEQATKAVAQAEAGRAGALQRLLPGIEKGATAQKALAEATRITAGAATKYGDTFAGSQARLAAAISKTEVTIGTALIPTVTRLSTRLSDWLDKSKNQKRIQDDVTQAVRLGSEFVRDAASAYDHLKGPVKFVVEALGGFKQVIEGIIALKLARMLGVTARSFLQVQEASAKTAAVVATNSAAEVAAIREVGTAASTSAGRVGLLSTRLTTLGKLGVIGVTLDVFTNFLPQNPNIPNPLKGIPIAGKVFGFGQNLTGGNPEDLSQVPKVKNALKFFRGSKDLGVTDVIGDIQTGALATKDIQKLHGSFADDFNYQAALLVARTVGKRRADAALARMRAVGPGSPLYGGTFGPGGLAALTPLARNALARTSAAGTPGSADDLRALAEQRLLLGRQIEVESGRLANAVNRKQAQKFADNLRALQDEDNAAADQIASIHEQAAQAAARNAARIKAADAKAKAAALEAGRRTEYLAQFALGEATRGVTLGVETKKLDKAAATAKAVAAKARQKMLDIKEGALTLERQAADLAVARAGDNQTLLDKAIALERRADQKLIKYYAEREKAAKTALERQDAAQKKIATQIDLAGLKRGKTAGGFTLGQLFAEASSEFALYGGNVGGPGSPLSPQDARGQLGGIIGTHKTQQTTVVQNFYGDRSAGQGIQDAYRVARNMK